MLSPLPQFSGWTRRLALAAVALMLASASASLGAESTASSGPPPDPAAAALPEAPPAEAASLQEGRTLTGKIRGTVVDQARLPLSGVLVQLASKSEKSLLRVTGTDERGQYQFQDLPAGTYELEVAAGTGLRSKKGGIEVRPPFQNIVDFRVGGKAAAPGTAEPAPVAGQTEGPQAAVTVRGRFFDQQKRAIEEVSVALMSLEGKGTFQASSGEDGAFTIAGVPPGLYRARVTSPGHVALDLKSVRVAPQAGLDLSLLLVDYPLHVKSGEGDLLPHEEPRPAPPSAP